ncbi:glycosyltransferase family 4 protein, partial [Bacteroides gallinaceum]|uniref:glycosyltransferase family 4 protein n=1 Tax=Bacteroides gallinaceum TaxID=1462571 RepID=UPI0025A383D5
DEICEKCNGRKFYQCFLNKCAKGKYSLSFFMALEQYFRNFFFNPSKYINGILYVSHFSQRKHEQYMPKLRNILNIVMHNFSLSIEDEVKGVGKEKYFLFLGRLSKEKGIETLVKAFEKCPNSKLIVAGTGPLENKLLKYKSINNIENIDFVGYKSGDELERLKKYAYFIIVPSECYENNPMAIIEGYSKGVPSIGANIGGIPEIILQNKTGFVFEMGSADNLAIVINKANNLSEKEYQEMRINSIEYALEDMSSKSYYRKLIPFYNRVIEEVKNHKK